MDHLLEYRLKLCGGIYGEEKMKLRSKFIGNNQFSGLTIKDRFWEKVDKKGEDGCWEWLGCCHHQWGYGSLNVGGKYMAAHRYSWELYFGKIPEGWLICHKCDNPSCVNPEHLFLGTNKDNSDDKIKKGRNASSVGENNGRSILTEDSVRQIFDLYKNRNYSHMKLGKMFNVHSTTIGHILQRKLWGHVELE